PWSVGNIPFNFRSVKTRQTQSHPDAIPAGLHSVSGLPLARIRRVTRGRMSAFVAAVVAVAARMPELEFLRTRLEVYRGRTPRDVTAPMPGLEISNTGMFVVAEIDRRHPTARVFDGPLADAAQDAVGAESGYQRAVAEAAGAEVARMAGEIDEDVQRLDRQNREIGEQLDRLAAERNDADAARTHAIESGRVDLTPPRIPSVASILWWRFCVLATLGGESYAFFLATANMNGTDPTALAAEWAQGAGGAIAGSAIVACVAAGCAFVLAEAARRHLAEATRVGASNRAFERRAAMLMVLVTAVLLGVIAEMRAGLAGQATAATIARNLVLAAVPLIAGTYVHAGAGRLAEQRRTALTRAATPDPLDVAASKRRAQEARLLEEREHIRAQRDVLIAKRNALNASVFSGAEMRRDLARHEGRVVNEFLDTVRAACAIDRTAFRLVARAFRRDSLLAASQAAEQRGALVPMRRRRSA
ncbi:MAG TPA: hypothetical protein VHK90_17295, partial [Thermoanaerobaculia bacterium]|nr:hypothetical protein [Thermoanaerobaculia bacterium]